MPRAQGAPPIPRVAQRGGGLRRAAGSRDAASTRRGQIRAQSQCAHGQHAALHSPVTCRCAPGRPREGHCKHSSRGARARR
eukprot:7645172-Pyramimonas_sp.AAC.1